MLRQETKKVQDGADWLACTCIVHTRSTFIYIYSLYTSRCVFEPPFLRWEGEVARVVWYGHASAFSVCVCVAGIFFGGELSWEVQGRVRK